MVGSLAKSSHISRTGQINPIWRNPALGLRDLHVLAAPVQRELPTPAKKRHTAGFRMAHARLHVGWGRRLNFDVIPLVILLDRSGTPATYQFMTNVRRIGQTKPACLAFD
jgi:hypothetical protein